MVNGIAPDHSSFIAFMKLKSIPSSLIKDKPLKPGSYRGRKSTAPEKKQMANGDKHA